MSYRDELLKRSMKETGKSRKEVIGDARYAVQARKGGQVKEPKVQYQSDDHKNFEQQRAANRKAYHKGKHVRPVLHSKGDEVSANNDPKFSQKDLDRATYKDGGIYLPKSSALYSLDKDARKDIQKRRQDAEDIMLKHANWKNGKLQTENIKKYGEFKKDPDLVNLMEEIEKDEDGFWTDKIGDGQSNWDRLKTHVVTESSNEFGTGKVSKGKKKEFRKTKLGIFDTIFEPDAPRTFTEYKQSDQPPLVAPDPEDPFGKYAKKYGKSGKEYFEEHIYKSGHKKQYDKYSSPSYIAQDLKFREKQDKESEKLYKHDQATAAPLRKAMGEIFKPYVKGDKELLFQPDSVYKQLSITWRVLYVLWLKKQTVLKD